jgi:hypothetical protein
MQQRLVLTLLEEKNEQLNLDLTFKRKLENTRD